MGKAITELVPACDAGEDFEFYDKFLKEGLEKSKIEAADPATKWVSHEELMQRLEEIAINGEMLNVEC